ncbi:MAG: LLM class flavin-dependent oxidoreductase [Chloroflexia bacterium]
METARLTPCPRRPRPRAATAGPLMSERTGRLVDGIITVGAADEKIKNLMGRFEKGAREAGQEPDTMLRTTRHLSWAESDQAAEDQAVKEWPNGG